MRHLLVLLVISIGISSCDDFFEQDVYVEIPEHTPRIVVNAALSPHDSIQLFISKSAGINTKESINTYLPDITYQIVKNGQESVTDLLLDPQGFYGSSVIPMPGDHFSINIQAPGYEGVHAEVEVPLSPTIVEAGFSGVTYDFDGYAYNIVKVKIKDDSSLKNFYETSILVRTITYIPEEDTSYIYEYYENYLYTNTPWLRESQSGMGFSDLAFAGGVGEFELHLDEYLFYNSWDGDSETKYFVSVKAISEDYYEYLIDYNLHQWNQYPDLFSGEPVPMVTNIENGFGILGAFSESRIEIAGEPEVTAFD